MRAIYLTGFMGSGKTTISQELAKKVGMQAYDTDAFIEEKHQMPIREIFTLKGEEFFRQEEHVALKQLPNKNVVIATGGGIVTREINREWMKEHGIVVYLYTDLEEIIRRLEGDDSRPLLKGKSHQELKQLFEKRRTLYEQADVTIETTSKSILEIINELSKRISDRNLDNNR